MQGRLVSLQDDAEAPLPDHLLHLVVPQRSQQALAVGGPQEVQVGGRDRAAGGRPVVPELLQHAGEGRVAGDARRVAELPADPPQHLRLSLAAVEPRLAIPALLQVLLEALPLVGRDGVIQQRFPALEPRALRRRGHGGFPDTFTVPGRTGRLP